MPSVTVSLAQWQVLSQSEREAVLHLRVGEQQIEFAGTVERAVAKCEADKENDVIGLAIQVSGEVVGFLVLNRRSKAPEWAQPGAAVISAMRVDQSLQGTGIGSAALLALPEWVSSHWPECQSLSLTVDEENSSGIRAYAKSGFQDHGIRVQGRIGWVRYMSKSVAGAQ